MGTANTLNITLCRSLGVPEHLLQLWQHGTVLEGHVDAPPFDLRDYPSVREQPEIAALEYDRLSAAGRILWYDGDGPDDLDICPSTLVCKTERVRLAHDWTKAGLNEFLTLPPTSYDTMDTLVASLRPNCCIAGLDIKDCFLHWAIRPSSRRRLGVRHPMSGRKGVYLFMPPG